MSLVPYQTPQLGLKPTGFQFSVGMFPNVNFAVQSVTVPPVNFGIAVFENPVQPIKVPGDKLEYGSLHVRLMLDEELVTYMELYGWMRDLGFDPHHADLAHLLQQNRNGLIKVDKTLPVSDMFLTVLNSKNNPTVTFNFKDAFPIFIGQLSFDTTENGQNYMYCDVEFCFNWFTIDKAVR